MIEHEDVMPTETEGRNQRLIEFLGKVYETRAEDAQSLGRVRARLLAGKVPLPMRNAIDTGAPLRRQQGNGEKGTGELFLESGWRYRLNSLAAVLVAALLVGSLLTVLNLGHRSATGAGSGTAALSTQHVSQKKPKPLPFLTVPYGWTLLGRLSGQGDQNVEHAFVPGAKWQALLSCQGSKTQLQLVLSGAYPHAQNRDKLPAKISYIFLCASPSGTQVFPSPTGQGSIVAQVSADKQTSWSMIIIACQKGGSACG